MANEYQLLWDSSGEGYCLHCSSGEFHGSIFLATVRNRMLKKMEILFFSLPETTGQDSIPVDSLDGYMPGFVLVWLLGREHGPQCPPSEKPFSGHTGLDDFVALHHKTGCKHSIHLLTNFKKECMC